VLRRGRKVGTIAAADATLERLAEMTVGRQVLLEVRPEPHPFGDVVLQAENLQADDDAGQPAVKGLSLHVCAGEVLGIAGVAGNGQQQLAEVLAGLRPLRAGRIMVRGAHLAGLQPEAFIRHGVGYIPADRHKVGLILDFSIAENLVVKRVGEKEFARRGVLRLAAMRRYAERIVGAYDIRTGDAAARAGELSGGNQQKVVLAREIEDGPSVLVAVHPTRGLDIGATEYVHQRLLEQRERGVGIVLISTELEELLALSDRIAVMFRGQIMGEVPGEGAPVELIGRMMLGERPAEEATRS